MIRALGSFKEITQAGAVNPEAFIGNPVNAFLLIKQMSLEIKSFVSLLNNFEKLKGNQLLPVFLENKHIDQESF